MDKREFIRKYHSMTGVDLAKELGVSVQTICRYAKKFGIGKGKGQYDRNTVVKG